MKTTRLNSFIFLLLIPLFSMLTEKMPESWLEGPFNHDISGDFFDDKKAVGNTLYYDNNTKYYTAWDEDRKKYITYNKTTNNELTRVVFNAPELDANGEETSNRANLVAGWNNVVKEVDGPRGVVFEGAVAMPTSHLDEEGMRIQAEFGCAGCHSM